jgi:hypothetical protein
MFVDFNTQRTRIYITKKKKRIKIKTSPYKGSILWSANEGLPGEEVGFGDRA